MCWRGRRERNTGSVEEAMRGGPSHDATCHGASRLVSRSDIERFKGMAFDKTSIQAVSSVLWNPSVSGSEQSYPQKAWNLKKLHALNLKFHRSSSSTVRNHHERECHGVLGGVQAKSQETRRGKDDPYPLTSFFKINPAMHFVSLYFSIQNTIWPFSL